MFEIKNILKCLFFTLFCPLVILSQTNESLFFEKIIPSKSSKSNLHIVDNYLVNYSKGEMSFWDTGDDYKKKFSVKFGSTDYVKTRFYKIKNSKSSIGVLAPKSNNLNDGVKLYITKIKDNEVQLDSINCKGRIYDFCLSNDGKKVYYIRKSTSPYRLGLYAWDMNSKKEIILLDKLNRIEGETDDYRTKFQTYNNFKLDINHDDSIISILGRSILLVDLSNGDVEEVYYKQSFAGQKITLMKFTPNSNKIILCKDYKKDLVYDLITKKWQELKLVNYVGSQSFYFDKSRSSIAGKWNYLLVRNEESKVSDTIFSKLAVKYFTKEPLINKENICIDENNTMYIFEYHGISKLELNRLGKLEYELPLNPIIKNNINQAVISNYIDEKKWKSYVSNKKNITKVNSCLSKINSSSSIPSKAQDDIFYNKYSNSKLIKKKVCSGAEVVLNNLMLNDVRFGSEVKILKNNLLVEEYYIDIEGRKYGRNTYRYKPYTNKLLYVFYRGRSGLINSMVHYDGFNSSNTVRFKKEFKTEQEALARKENSSPKVKIIEVCQACKGTGIGGTDAWTGNKHRCTICNGSGKTSYEVNKH